MQGKKKLLGRRKSEQRVGSKNVRLVSLEKEADGGKLSLLRE